MLKTFSVRSFSSLLRSMKSSTPIAVPAVFIMTSVISALPILNTYWTVSNSTLSKKPISTAIQPFLGLRSIDIKSPSGMNAITL